MGLDCSECPSCGLPSRASALQRCCLQRQKARKSRQRGYEDAQEKEPKHGRARVAGKRMRAADWAECPSCGLPARADALTALLSAEPECPACRAVVHPAAVVVVAGLAEQRLRALRG